MSPNHGGALKSPSLIVLHYTAGSSFDGALSWLYQKNSKASAHYLVGRDGKTELIVPTTTVAWHAGRSAWKGREKVNTFSLGITLVNLGPLDDDGAAIATGELLKHSDVYVGKHKRELCAYKHWQRYPQEQLEATQQLVSRLLVQYPTLVELVDHSDVAGFRGKWDVGPALQFSMDPSSRSASISPSI